MGARITVACSASRPQLQKESLNCFFELSIHNENKYSTLCAFRVTVVAVVVPFKCIRCKSASFSERISLLCSWYVALRWLSCERKESSQMSTSSFLPFLLDGGFLLQAGLRTCYSDSKFEGICFLFSLVEQNIARPGGSGDS